MCWKNLIGIARVRLIILDQNVNYVIFVNRFILFKILANQSRVFWTTLKQSLLESFVFQAGIVTKFPFDAKKLFLRKV